MPSPNTSPTASPVSERRTQARIHAQIPVRLQYSGESRAHTVTLVDLSWGGALCESKTQLPGTDAPVRLLLPWNSGETIQIEAALLRQKALEDGRYLLALRFMRLSLLHQTRLEKLLSLMQAQDSNTEEQEASRLVDTLEIQIQTLDEWRWALGDIAKGLLRINATKLYARGQSLAIQFNGIPSRARLRLRSRVMDSKSVPMHDLYLLTLEFEHPLDALRGWAEWLLGQMPNEADLPAVQEDRSRTEKLPDLGQGRVVPTQDQRSALEKDFPEALDYLITAWGDIKAFDLVFRQLIFGESNVVGTWTPEAWEELQLLQSLHDRAYGISDIRFNSLEIQSVLGL
ncbi:PilZ domain-containing protein [Allochromatium tepidum]|uniref:PilZ domain-containing protein n=1 Tax=Allochromatium tepidum TaxID=553982 RepID=A0ABM7QQ38_9GAMM|nr:PilZ domain-containing protein [Allochromatium tepidum]BCU08066.1 hypothetical protein Atep_27430 [Allochromatium tepidum]